MRGPIGGAVTAQVMQRIIAPGGANASLAGLTQGGQGMVAPLDMAQIRTQNVAADLAEKSNTVTYPALNIYCEKIVNALTQKFQTFSGSAQMAIEVRHSQDRLDGLQNALEVYTDALTQVLDMSRGDWGSGMYYAGGYQVAFGAVKHGGRNFVQGAKVTFEIGVNIN